jgi:hypothetical protein
MSIAVVWYTTTASTDGSAVDHVYYDTADLPEGSQPLCELCWNAQAHAPPTKRARRESE